MLNFYPSSPRLSLKTLIHTMAFSLIADIIWYLLFKSIYFGEDNINTYYFKKIGVLKIIVMFMFIFELLVKLVIFIVGLNEYKNVYGLNEAFVIDYMANLDGIGYENKVRKIENN